MSDLLETRVTVPASPVNPPELHRENERGLAEAEKMYDTIIRGEKRDFTPEESERFDRLTSGPSNALLRTRTEDLGRRLDAAKQQHERNVEQIGGRKTDLRALSNEPVGMSNREIHGYSILKAISASISGNWRHAGLEWEASQAYGHQIGRDARSFWIPPDILH